MFKQPQVQHHTTSKKNKTTMRELPAASQQWNNGTMKTACQSTKMNAKYVENQLIPTAKNEQPILIKYIS